MRHFPDDSWHFEFEPDRRHSWVSGAVIFAFLGFAFGFLVGLKFVS